ncbi:phage baseplate plug family protein [Neisseria blantyrii]|uniref:phage baseplate plug family protein n=1 Tax=Neisseria blantyrii TaxID=2830647 RepID=UPI00272BBE0E|nr:hypothetical protein [Neisseria blantyrii]
MIYQIPLKPVPVQKVSATLGGQDVTVSLLPRLGKLYASVSADGRVLIRERVCLHGMPLVGEAYRGFRGDLYFIDKQGAEDPQWQELGGRFILVYHDGH